MARMQCTRPHLAETGGATCLCKWLLGILFVLTSLRTATCRPADATEADNAPIEAREATLDITSPDGQKDVSPPTTGIIISALVASVGKTPKDDQAPSKMSSNAMRFKQKSGHVAPSRVGRMMRGLRDDNSIMNKFSNAWRDLNWKDNWAVVVLTIAVSCTTLILLSVIIGVTCAPSSSVPSMLERLKVHNEMRRQILAKRKYDAARLEERQSLLMDMKDTQRKGHRHSLKQEKTYRVADVDSESAESVQPRRKSNSSSRRQSQRSNTSVMRSNTSLKRGHTPSHRRCCGVAAVHESQ